MDDNTIRDQVNEQLTTWLRERGLLTEEFVEELEELAGEIVVTVESAYGM
jgi:hypothetical protein